MKKKVVDLLQYKEDKHKVLNFTELFYLACKNILEEGEVPPLFRVEEVK